MRSALATYLILFLGVLALSTSAIFVKLADASSAVTAFYRMLIAALILMPVLLCSKSCRNEIQKLSFRQWKQSALAGLFLALHYVLWFESLNYTSVASSTVIVCLQPVFSLAFDKILNKRTVKKSSLTGCFIALFGCFVIGLGDFQISGKSLFGDILAFVAASVIALYFFVGEKIRKEISAVTFSVLSYSISAVILLLYILLLQQPFSGFTTQTWLAFWGLALIPTIGGQFVFNLLLKNISASAVTMSILGEPVGTCFLAYIILHETISMQQFAGIAAIMLGIFIFFYPFPQKRQQHT